MAEPLASNEQRLSSTSAPFPRPPRRLSSYFAPAIVVLALISALGTFLVLTGILRLPAHLWVWLQPINLALAIVLAVVVTWEVWGVIRAQRKGRAGAKLHTRVMLLFALVATVPAVLVAILAIVTQDRAFDRYFARSTRAIVENSALVADAYLREHSTTMIADVQSLANVLGRSKQLFETRRDEFNNLMRQHAYFANTPGVALIRSNGTVLEKVVFVAGRDISISPNIKIEQATEKQPIIYVIPEGDALAVISPLPNFEDTYLLLVRPIDARVVGYLQTTEKLRQQYRLLETNRPTFQRLFGSAYALIALILLLSAVWVGLNFANRLVAPIRRLITAADLVASGNLYVQVPVRQSEGDLASLGESFNKMTSELRTQNADLVRARDQFDERRRFSEAVLAGVGAGVVGLSAEGKITIMNRSAERLLNASEANMIGRAGVEAIPEIKALIQEAFADNQRVNGTVAISRGGRERMFNVRVTTEQADEDQHGYVITLDDITELVTAQRTSAWADIARRIAHEIKNPLTPIQLSAERLKRKYGKALIQDREVFEQCTETIIRQVGDIGRMVDEFSSFARMPKPVVETQDLAETIRQAVFLQRVGKPEIKFEVELPNGAMTARFDRRLISQALTNILKNAGEAIEVLPADRRGSGRILVRAKRDGETAVIDVIDNGPGLPKENRERLLEPYVTTRDKGTGLGLAIVGKIFEEHGGSIQLNDAPADFAAGKGAWVRLTLAADGIKAVGSAAQSKTEGAAAS
jgi:two-component system nitrogen regulation sensor histidine kinase NtrY